MKNSKNKDKYPESMTFQPGGRVVNFSQGESILEIAVRGKIELNHSCGGSGSCGTCRVIVRDGLERMEARGDVEAEMAVDRGFSAEERLGCQVEAFTGLVVEVPGKPKL